MKLNDEKETDLLIGCSCQVTIKKWHESLLVRSGLLLLLASTTLICTIVDSKAAATQQTTFTLEPSEDAYVSQLNSNSNYGHDEVISIRSFKTITESFNHRIYLKFNLTPLNQESHIIFATLHLYKYIEGNHVGVRKIEVKRVLGEWSEASITWSDQPHVSEVSTSSTHVDRSGYWYQWDVTPDVRSWIEKHVQNNGVCLLDSEEDSTIDYASVFFSREAAEMYMYRPRLEIILEPENLQPRYFDSNLFPVMIMVGGVGLLVMLGFIKKLKNPKLV
jgi:hypothetical protein